MPLPEEKLTLSWGSRLDGQTPRAFPKATHTIRASAASCSTAAASRDDPKRRGQQIEDSSANRPFEIQVERATLGIRAK